MIVSAVGDQATPPCIRPITADERITRCHQHVRATALVAHDGQELELASTGLLPGAFTTFRRMFLSIELIVKRWKPDEAHLHAVNNPTGAVLHP